MPSQAAAPVNLNEGHDDAVATSDDSSLGVSADEVVDRDDRPLVKVPAPARHMLLMRATVL